jgi:polyhydroxyalkanoate synthesis regulator phasin
MAEQAKKAAPKRKTTARKTSAAKTTARKTAAKRKPVARKTTARKTASKKVTSLQNRVSDAGRSAFLASLGFYGMAFDQMQDQLKSVESELSARRKKADKLYTNMVKRGEKVEKRAKNVIEDIELPKLDDVNFDRAKLEAQLEKAKARFEELKGSVGIKTAA